MSIPDYSVILNKAESYRKYSAQLLSEMIKIPSVSGDEEKLIRFLEKEFTSCGADEVRIDDFGNIIARIGNGKPIIAIDAHIDTVDVGQPDQWLDDPFSGAIKDNTPDSMST